MTALWLTVAFVAGGALTDRLRARRCTPGRHRSTGRARRGPAPARHTQPAARETGRFPITGGWY